MKSDLHPAAQQPRQHERAVVSSPGAGVLIRCDTEALSIVLARAAAAAHGGADGALVCPLRLGQPSASGWSGRARLWCTLGVPPATGGEVMAH